MGYHVVRWDYYGHGWSQAADEEHDMDESVFDVQAREVIAAAGHELKLPDSGFMVNSPLREVPNVALWVGWDLGAMLGLAMVDAHSGLIQRMVMLAPPLSEALSGAGGCCACLRAKGPSVAARLSSMFVDPVRTHQAPATAPPRPAIRARVRARPPASSGSYSSFRKPCVRGAPGVRSRQARNQRIGAFDGLLLALPRRGDLGASLLHD